MRAVLDLTIPGKQQESECGFLWHTLEGKAYDINEKAGERTGRKGMLIGNRGYDHKYDYRFARPSSFHSGGVNVVFADGHGAFLREDIPYWVYVQLMTPNGQKATIDAYKNIPAPPEYKQLLSASDYQ